MPVPSGGRVRCRYYKEENENEFTNFLERFKCRSETTSHDFIFATISTAVEEVSPVANVFSGLGLLW